MGRGFTVVVVTFAAACVGGCAQTPAKTARAPADERATERAGREGPLFLFSSQARINLHERVLLPATARFAPPEGTVREWPPPALDEAWATAVGRYQTELQSMFSEEHAAMQRTLRVGDDQSFCTVDASSALCPLWESYRADRWAADDQANQEWIEHIGTIRPQLWQAIAADLAHKYQTPWPDNPLVVEVAAEVGGPGAAYTTSAGYITMGSTDPRNRGEHGLEILFHEASHLLFAPFDEALAHAEAKTGLAAPPSLWHAILFYTTGHVLQTHLGEAYVPYAAAQGLYQREPWDAFETALDAEWRPYLRGERDLARSTEALLKRLAP